jgi:hypothetical protein
MPRRRKHQHPPVKVDPDKGCDGKRRYSVSGVAEREAERLGMDYYPCVRCGGWHLTTRPEVRALRRGEF